MDQSLVDKLVEEMSYDMADGFVLIPTRVLVQIS